MKQQRLSFGTAAEGDNLSGAFLEVPVVLTGNNTLVNATLREEGDIGGWHLLEVSLDGSVSEVLDGGLELIVTVEV